MAHTLELYWDFSSPFAYLGSTQADALAKRTGATLVWRPMLLGAVFKAIGSPDVPMSTWSDAKRTHTMLDMQRWAAHWEVPFRFPSRFPMSTVKALRVWLALPAARRDAFRKAVFRAYWIDGLAPSDEKTMRDVLGAAGHDASAILAKLDDAKDDLRRRTDEAIALGIFGAPAFVVGDQLFWGQDRMHFVERALGGWRV